MNSIHIDYKPGTLNVILVVPHGGRDRPQEIPERKPTGRYNNLRYCIEPDWRTLQAAEQIREHLHTVTGKYPYFIANLLDRALLDPNREIEEATFGHPLTRANYEFYHNMIEKSKAELENSHNYRGALVIDIHGQSHPHGLTELGYAIPAHQIDSGIYSLTREGTLRCAASNPNRHGDDFQLLVGKQSLGNFLEAEDVHCLPSPSNSQIGGRMYFNGGYTIRTHFSEKADAIQVEMSRTLRSTESPQLSDNMLKVARGIANFCKLHYENN